MNISIVSRGKGHSAVAAAAYRAGDIIKNDYDGQTHDYTRKKGIVYTEMLLSSNAPDDYGNRATLWNSVEKIEKNKNAQLAREVRLALPAEFTIEQNINLVHEYIRDNFVYHGMIADICIHDKGDGNPHAHVLLTMRPLEQDGSWGAKSKMEYILDDNGERIKLPSGRYKVKKVTATDWDERSKVEEWRKAWADILNVYLENGGHESRVDHRSYERQGLEQIPTIHLGVSAHQMEQKGIRTERGDINRNIKAANERLKSIDNQIYEIKNPPMPQMIIDLEKSIKAQESPGYANWCKIFNLKQAAQTLIYIQENKLTDIESLQSAYQTAKTDHANIQKQINANRGKIKSLSALKTQAEAYRATAEIYKKYTARGQFKHFKDDFYARHKDEIEKHIKARAYIFDELKLDKFPSLKKLSGDISELYEKEKALRLNLNTAQQKMKALSNVEHNICALLGYDKLESAGYAPTIPTDGLRNTTRYSSSFEEADKMQNTEHYFQSRFIDFDCACAVIRAIGNCKGQYDKAAAEVLEIYGKDRAEAVIAAMVNNAPDDKFAEHREWAAQIDNWTHLEPTVRNMDVFEKLPYSFDVMNMFVKKFREASGSFYQTRSWDKDLNFKERMTAAEQLVKERESNRQKSPPRKTNRNSDPDL
ncbi:MAG: MobA/MobL family protein [Oscillospiraceae bacterium]|nr:MobA/MobL family protein [Oscillospiraceae bacterium]